ncbi:MAG: rRNA maturation RNase YbeY [Longimicrobiales bacterium]
MNSADASGPRVQIGQMGGWPLPHSLLEKAVLEVFRDGGIQEGEISLTFLDDDGIRTLNHEYLDRDRPTDVLAFPLHEPGQAIVGDVYVGYEQARRQSGAEGVPLEEELVRLAIHGSLHVLGHDHPPGEDRWASPMFRIQEEILARALSR